jgi:hypothetical protein
MEKNYVPDSANTSRASEPIATYGNASTTENRLYHPTSREMEVIMQSKKEFEEGCFYTQEEVDKMEEEWLR